jgi:flavodoxin
MEKSKKMKILVVYYSRQGHTGKVAKQIAKKLNADIEAVIDLKDRKHIINWVKSDFDEEKHKPTEIKPLKYNSSDFDLTIIGTPNWDGVTPAIWAYLNKYKFKKVAYFVTFGAAAENTLVYMEKLTGKKPIATLEIQDRQIKIGEDKRLIKEFCNTIKYKMK